MTRKAYTILQVSAEYPPDPGGVGDYTQHLGRALIACGHRVVVATGQPATETSHSDLALQQITNGWSWRSLGSVCHAIQRRNPDLVHIQYQTGAYHMHPAINFVPWFIRHHFPGVRIVVTMHDLRMPYLFPKAAPARRWVTRRLLVDAHALVVTNQADHDALQGMTHGDKDNFVARTPLAATVIPIGSNIDVAPPKPYHRDEWRGRLGADATNIVIAFFGLVSSTKGLLELVLALAALPHHIRLVVVGGATPQPQDQRYLDEIRATIERLGLTGRIVFTGHCSPADVSGFLLASDLVALPFSDGASYRRGSLLAALAHERPVITTHPPHPLHPPLVSGEHALLVHSNQPQPLAEAIARLAADSSLRQHLGTQGRHLTEHFSWSSIAAQHEDVYNALV